MSDVGLVGPSAWPGEDALAAARAILDVTADPPTGVLGRASLAALPGRGPHAHPLGRTLAMLEQQPVQLEPHGWRLGGAADATLRRARRTLADDVEAFALAAVGSDASLVLPVVGPLSLAASLWLPVGERAVADDVALGDLVESLEVGVTRHREAVSAGTGGVVVGRTGAAGSVSGQPVEPDADLPVVLLHEPLLAEVLQGAVPTFSGRSRLRALSADAVAAHLAVLVRAWAGALAVQVPPQAAAIDAVVAAGVRTLALDVTTLDGRGWESLAGAVEDGVTVWASSVPHAGVRPDDAARAVLAPWRAIGLASVPPPSLALRPGLDALAPERARSALALAARSATALGDLTA